MTRRPLGCGRRGQEVPGSGGGGLEDVGFFFFPFTIMSALWIGESSGAQEAGQGKGEAHTVPWAVSNQVG